MNVVVDTNVIVSALMNVHGTPAKVVSLILSGDVNIHFPKEAGILTPKDFIQACELPL
jgi:predicted nucleic acid-binding protein